MAGTSSHGFKVEIRSDHNSKYSNQGDTEISCPPDRGPDSLALFGAEAIEHGLADGMGKMLPRSILPVLTRAG
ncbi:hypothetical protein [Paracoccus fontiphilus]|uniref:hypothetical protein n=1 Tax=Paracoccus fontiphilus TaxID=1815556 RepID=UPI001A964804|nr:hypothetical protein [Paracoccus fontiphilus]